MTIRTSSEYTHGARYLTLTSYCFLFLLLLKTDKYRNNLNSPQGSWLSPEPSEPAAGEIQSGVGTHILRILKGYQNATQRWNLIVVELFDAQES